MWFQISIAWFLTLCLLFAAVYIPMKGARWLKHKQLGPFARFIQASPRRNFFTFLTLTFLLSSSVVLMLEGYWLDAMATNTLPASTVPMVEDLLFLFLILTGLIPLLWSRYRAWRQYARAKASRVGVFAVDDS